MKITEFARKVAYLEGRTTQVDIAQISEILKCINKLTGGVLYTVIRLMK